MRRMPKREVSGHGIAPVGKKRGGRCAGCVRAMGANGLSANGGDHAGGAHAGRGRGGRDDVECSRRGLVCTGIPECRMVCVRHGNVVHGWSVYEDSGE